MDDRYELNSCILSARTSCIQRALPMAQTVSRWPVNAETPDPPGVMADEAAVGQAFCSGIKPPIPAVVRSKAYVCGRSLAGTVGSNPAEGMDVCLLLVLCVVR